MAFTGIDEGIYSDYSNNGDALQEPTLLKIVSQSELEEFWGLNYSNATPLPPVPYINFDEEIVLVVVDQVMPDNSSFYSIKIDKIVEYEDKVVVFAMKTRGGTGCVFDQVISQAYQIVKTTDRDKPFSLSLTETTKDCGPN